MRNNQKVVSISPTTKTYQYKHERALARCHTENFKCHQSLLLLGLNCEWIFGVTLVSEGTYMHGISIAPPMKVKQQP